MGLPSRLAAAMVGPAAALYITSQRNRLDEAARPLSESLCRAMGAHFHTNILTATRLYVGESLPLPATLANLPGVPSPSAIGGITFDHVIATRRTPDPAFLFHELVHVVQYRLLGVSRFARMYVRGFLESGSYANIPLEQHAYQLEWRFREGGLFSVEALVKDWIVRQGAPPKENGGSAL
jgi:hypothetical protein